MKSNHTAGPWTIRRDTRYDHAYGIEKTDGKLRSILALMNDQWLCEEHGHLEANAKLIAAAPDLLAACQIVLDNINIHHKFKHLRETLETAIQKATGES